MKLRSFIVLHRRMGLISAIFVLLLSLTGLLLHYSNSLGLDQNYVGSQRLLSWYGIEAPQVSVSFAAESGSRVSQIGGALYVDSERLNGDFAELVGIATTEFGYVIATRRQLILLTPDAEIIEVLNQSHGLPQTIEALGQSDGGELFLRTPLLLLGIDVDSLSFTEVANTGISWSEASRPDEAMQLAIRQDYASALISWERLLLDLHSGQLFGWLGRILVDVMAILFILMAMTGIWIWSRRRT